MKRFLSVLLLLALLFTLLPVGSLAANTDGFFYFSAENDDTLVVSPQKIPYSANQTIAEALSAAGVVLTYDTGNSFVTMINGVDGGYTYASDGTGCFLSDPASGAHFFAFYGIYGDGTIGEGRQALMQRMAAYLEEPADVQNAAKDSYNAALFAYLGISDANASQLAAELQAAIDAYQSSLSDTYSVTVSASEEGCEFLAESSFGLTYTSDSGAFSLPKGTYTITARKENREASVTREITESTAVTGLTLPEGSWLDESSLALSSTNDNDGTFTDGKYVLTHTENGVLAAIPDTFSGKLYVYALRSAEAPKDASLYVRYTGASGNFYDQTFTEGSWTTSLSDVLARGTAGNTVQFSLDRKAEGCTQRMTLTLKLDRLPTLADLTVTARSADNKRDIRQAAKEGAFSSLQTQYTYQLLSSLSEVTICPTASMPGYSITVDGKAVASGEGAAVALNGETEVPVTVSGGGYTNTYTLTLQPGEGQSATFNTADGVTLCVTNAAGEVLDYDSARNSTTGGMSYFYTLVSGETYTYVATKDTYYHASAQFTLTTATSFSNITVPVEEPLSALALGANASYGNPNPYALTPEFSAAEHRYTATVPDSMFNVAAWAEFSTGDCQVMYAKADTGVQETVSLKSESELGTRLTKAVLSENGLGNELTFRLSRRSGSITYYTDYIVELRRSFSLKALKVYCGSSEVELSDSNGKAKKYDPLTTAYTLWTPSAAASLELQCSVHTENSVYGQTEHGYTVTANGDAVSASGTISVPLSGTEQDDSIEIRVSNRLAADAQATTITLTVHKLESTAVRIQAKPDGALLFLRERSSNQPLRVRDDGSYAISKGFVYDYCVTKSGSIGQGGALRVTDDGKTVELGEISAEGAFVLKSSHSAAETLMFTLADAPVNSSLKTTLSAQWADFRGTQYQNGKADQTAGSNNGVTAARTPVNAEEGTLYWAAKIGTGVDSGAAGCPILAGDALITYSANQIYRIDPDTGKTLTRGTMASTSNFSIVPPTYSDGMVFVGLKDGQIQAFDAVTLQSLWIYRDPLGGQPNSPITVRDGYLYTGFWNSETKKANYVCLSVTDEDPEKEDEEKLATWTYTQKGGFYWAGAYVGDGWLLVGTDDGYSGYDHSTGQILLLDSKTGEKLDSRSGFRGDVRSTVCYDAVTAAYYATSKGGDFIRIKLDETGRKITESKTLALQNGNANSVAMSTSTPVVYNGRAYIGVSGTGQFTPYSGHNITVIDLTSWSIAYRVQTQGYPQTSGLLTTAYEGDNGCVYVYFFDNYTPGTLRMLRDSPGQTAAELLTLEIDAISGTQYQTAYALFTPAGEQTQYAICSPIVDKNGTMYFKNDSGYLMAFGSALKSMRVTNEPNKTEYEAGERFDPDGLQVEGKFANGVTRDVTKLLSFPTGAVQEADTSVSAEFGGTSMYHNSPESSGEMKAGVKSAYAPIEIPITITGMGVTSGKLGTAVDWSYNSRSGRLTVTGKLQSGQTLLAACYDAEGRMTMVQRLTKMGSLTLEKNSATVKLFLVDSVGKPACASVTATE